MKLFKLPNASTIKSRPEKLQMKINNSLGFMTELKKDRRNSKMINNSNSINSYLKSTGLARNSMIGPDMQAHFISLCNEIRKRGF